MKFRWFMLGLLVIATLSVTWAVWQREVPRQDMQLSPLVDRGTEVLQALDVVGRSLTVISEAEERRYGQAMAELIETEIDPANQAYLQGVLATLLESAELRRAETDYEIRLVRSYIPNAWALPGGFLYVTRGLMEWVTSEAELAAIIGHEIAHVDRGHCAARIQYREAAKEVSGELGGWLASWAYDFYSVGYRDEEEEEADRVGMMLLFASDYDLNAAVRAQQVLSEFAPSPPQATTIEREIERTIVAGLGDYFQTHPPPEVRIANLERAIREMGLVQDRGYVGVENHRQRVPRRVESIKSEWRWNDVE